MTFRPVRNAVWWVADYAYAAVWQVRAFFSRTDPGDFVSGEGRPIVVLPGVYETWRFLQPLITELHDRGHPVHVITALGRNRWPVPRAARHVAEYLQRHALDDVVIVAHSKGGLVGKQVMVDAAVGSRVRGMVAVASPFAGSVYGRLMLVPALRAFSPSAPGILALAREVAPNARIVSVYGEFDPHIPGGSELDGARNVRLETGGHFRILAHPRVIAEVVRLAE
ncbi:putative acetyltransferase [Microbacterium sp. TS-1]|uniref:Pimeloyl-ACP methyl ester carboxylesterase n=1 Tax=Microbacterium paludicola TaxID=300019 RepID=A0ABU1HWP2_9MICO|nr:MULTISPECIES: acetyltransferase [Microbacterium]MDR6166064.1 pimeloyl-ACP methyl ester carboxylesterase [Microbacterium paludicola]GAD33284.1 putative acetyltransferase [Microbacterium sp. TS-1]